MASRRTSVHLVASKVLIATRWTERDRPAEYYVIDGDTYDVTSFQTVIEPDGSSRFDAQVSLRP